MFQLTSSMASINLFLNDWYTCHFKQSVSKCAFAVINVSNNTEVLYP